MGISLYVTGGEAANRKVLLLCVCIVYTIKSRKNGEKAKSKFLIKTKSPKRVVLSFLRMQNYKSRKSRQQQGNNMEDFRLNILRMSSISPEKGVKLSCVCIHFPQKVCKSNY